MILASCVIYFFGVKLASILAYAHNTESQIEGIVSESTRWRTSGPERPEPFPVPSQFQTFPVKIGSRDKSYPKTFNPSLPAQRSRHAIYVPFTMCRVLLQGTARSCATSSRNTARQRKAPCKSLRRTRKLKIMMIITTLRERERPERLHRVGTPY
jgi:hypothetical protein